MWRIPAVWVVCFKKTNVQIFLAGIVVGFLGLGSLTWFQSINRYSDYYLNARDEPVIYFGSVGNHSEDDTHHRMINTSLADKLFKKVKILCWIMTSPENHRKKAIHVKATWGKRCNKLLFMSTEEDQILPSVALPVVEDRPHLWAKTKEAMTYVYTNYYDKYDWFFKADDDTYAVMENLRYMLYYKNSSHPIYYGCKLKLNEDNIDYMSGGAGYVLSKEALRRFVEEALPNRAICKQGNTGDEDIEIGKCLQAVGVQLGDSLDEENRNRFTVVFVNKILIPGVLDDVPWYTNMIYNPHKLGFDCCSDNLISTHYVGPHQMYLLEYLIYHVTPFGRAYTPILERTKKTHYKESGNKIFDSTRSSAKWDDYD